MFWLSIALLLALIGVGLLFYARRQQQAAGLPVGEIVYADTGVWERCERPLFSPRYRLTGKPDYLVREHGWIVPVEVKPGRQTSEPYEEDILQLAAYCLLVEEEYGKRPPYGYLKYQQAVFRINYSESLYRQVLSGLQAMRRDFCASDVSPSHNEPQRCIHCGHRYVCDRRLA
ncbi:MAG: CRISPR-associated protein Cas4 [Anaerolineae bacterium]